MCLRTRCSLTPSLKKADGLTRRTDGSWPLIQDLEIVGMRWPSALRAGTAYMYIYIYIHI
jgi:hypothetical protein